MRHDSIDPNIFIEHRQQIAARLPPKSVAIVHAADALSTNGDGTVRYVPAADLFWLTGIEQAESILVLAPDATNPAHREMLFIRKPNANVETWEGHSLTKEEAQKISGIDTILWAEDFSSTLHPLLVDATHVFLNTNEHGRADFEAETRDIRMARQLVHRYPIHSFQRLAPILHGLRAVKNPIEVDIIRGAVTITKHGIAIGKTVTLDFTSGKMHVGSKVGFNAIGDGREISKDNFNPVVIRDPRIACENIRNYKVINKNIIVISSDYSPEKLIEEIFTKKILNDFKIIFLVSMDIRIEDNVDLLWGIFTRFDPSIDIHFQDCKRKSSTVTFEGQMIVDATFKSWYPKVIEMDKDISSMVNEKWKTY